MHALLDHAALLVLVEHVERRTDAELPGRLVVAQLSALVPYCRPDCARHAAAAGTVKIMCCVICRQRRAEFGYEAECPFRDSETLDRTTSLYK